MISISEMESVFDRSRNLSHGKLLCILSSNLSIFLYSNNRAMIKFMSKSLVHKAFDIYQVMIFVMVYLLCKVDFLSKAFLISHFSYKML